MDETQAELLGFMLADEEYALDARLTVTVADDRIHAMQKGGIGAFSPEEITQMVDKALASYKKVKKLFK